MFGSRRHRPVAQPLTRETANPNAATAAASAFLRREPANSLSSAAAAAALKARPTTPTNVAQVQSKRAMRRSASVSSTGSRDNGGRTLHRASSSGSMTERTFRSPSPARGAAPNSHDVPPVPSIPNESQLRTERTGHAHKRATSLQTQPFRTASQKMADGHGSWFGAATPGDLSNVRHSDAAVEPRISSDLRPTSPSSSINFSYPLSSHDPGSDNAMVYDANSRRMVPRAELLLREQSIRDASEKPVKKKNQAAPRSGSHLKKGNVSRIKGTAVDAPAPAPTAPQAPQVLAKTTNIVQQKETEAPKHTPEPETAIKEPVIEDSDQDAELDAELDSEPEFASESESDIAEPANHYQETSREVAALSPTNAPRTSPVKKRPSIVHELPELEDQYDQEARATSQSQEVLVPEAVRRNQSPPAQKEPEMTGVNTKTQETDTQATKTQELEPKSLTGQAIIATPREAVSRTRVHSESPARTPHFAPTTDQLVVRHEPPPRSLSPRKSAMKHRSPTRDEASPSEDGSEASSALASVGTHTDTNLARRKSARVSFDDQNTVVVGESAEPPEPDLTQIPSPQTKKAWHNIISRPKRDSVSLDEDEKMTPRPALPSFGSVREKKTRDFEERPLVRPGERPWSPKVPAAVGSNQSTPSHMPVEDPGLSSDLAIGSVFAQEQSSRNAANISKYREPLPPIVTSVDSPGYISNSPISSDDEIDTESKLSKKEPEQSTGSALAKGQGSTELAPRPDENIPVISLTHPSPRVPDDDRQDSPQDFFDLPGGFPEDDTTPKSEASITSQFEKVEMLPPRMDSDLPAQTAVSNPPATLTPQRSMESAGVTPPTPQMHDIQEEEEETDGSSIYSDAYEDLSDIEGDGFMSLDAIVDSPINRVSKKLFEKTVARSKENDATMDIVPIETASQEPLQTRDDWELAKAYWKSLSTDKRRQLEREAAEEAGEEADLEEAAPQPKKTKKRRSLDKSTEPVVSVEPTDPGRVYQIQPGTVWHTEAPPSPARVAKTKATGGSKLKKSMRGEEPMAPEQTKPTQSGSMRKSMRTSDAAVGSHDGHMRKSLRAEPEAVAVTGSRMPKTLRSNGPVDDQVRSRSSVTQKDRPSSYQPPSTEQVKNPRRNQSAERTTSSAHVNASPSTKPTPRRRGSDSSESSFRRARPGGGGAFGFKSTLRSNAREPASDAGRGSSRFSLRSLSPTGSAFRRNSGTVSPSVAMGGRMRQSLRGESSDRSTSSLRMSGFSRPSAKTKKAKKSRSTSRFADSSDEEDARPAFQSRFAESSDEDETPSRKPKQNITPRTMRNKASSSAAAAAAMGVPQSQREDEDSPELPDSDDEILQPQSVVSSGGRVAARPDAALRRSGSGRNSIKSPTLGQPASPQEPRAGRSGHSRRGSFLSILRRKKDDSGKISRPLSESAARRDTRLERSTDELTVIRKTGTPQNSRLQKRGPNWPLQENGNTLTLDDVYGEDESHDTYVNDEKRPSTSSGHGPSSPTSAVKQGILKRRSTSQGALGHRDRNAEFDNSLLGDQEGSLELPEQKKKKKFGSLRKVFGLHD